MSSYKPVRTKLDFVRRYVRGEFGNRAPTWPTLDQYLRSGYRSPVHVRCRVAGARTWYNVRFNQAHGVWSRAAAMYGAERLYVSGMAPHHHTLLQGEAALLPPHGLVLTYSTLRLPMRPALVQQRRQAVGLRAYGLLRASLCPNSYDWLQHLLTRYEDHTVEFSAFAVCWGVLPRHNTVFWEVRQY